MKVKKLLGQKKQGSLRRKLKFAGGLGLGLTLSIAVVLAFIGAFFYKLIQLTAQAQRALVTLEDAADLYIRNNQEDLDVEELSF